MTLALPDLLDKLDRILDDRVGLYKLTARKYPARLEEMAAKHAEVEQIRRTFRWCVAKAEQLKADELARKAALAGGPPYVTDEALIRDLMAETFGATGIDVPPSYDMPTLAETETEDAAA